jgi:prophage regulatory protein
MVIKEERFLREKEVCHIVGVSRSTIWRWEKQGKFPSRYIIFGSIVVWKYTEVMAWCEGITAMAA